MYKEERDGTRRIQSPVLNRDRHGTRGKVLRQAAWFSGLHHFAFNADSREDADRLYQFLLDNNIEVLDAPAEYDYMEGYYAVFFADPDGMKLELAHITSWPAA